MKKVIKQVVGIDISKDSFYVCYKVLTEDGNVSIKGTTSFKNNTAGYKAFYLWCKKRNKTSHIEIIYVMEATGFKSRFIGEFIMRNLPIFFIIKKRK